MPSAAMIVRAKRVVDQLTKGNPSKPKWTKGRGIVTCGGGYTYFTNAWVLIRMLRHVGCTLPIQLWYLGPDEVDDRMKRLVSRFDVECVDGMPIIEKTPFARGGMVKAGWVLKSVAVSRCPFEEVLFLDSDNLPVRDPSFLFEIPQYKATGAVFWPDSSVFAHKSLWRIFGIPFREEPEFESGQMLVDKRANWEAVSLAERINFRADVFYRFMWGDKDTFRFAWHKLKKAFAMPEFPPQALQAPGSGADMLCQHDFHGNRLFQHRIMYKWKLFGENPWIPGFFFENECRAFLEDLKANWDGRCGPERRDFVSLGEHPVVQNLLKRTWLLERPRESSKRRKVADKNAAVSKGSSWIELKFGKNGTLNSEAESAGTFWDIKRSRNGFQLTLSANDRRKLELTRQGAGWCGHWTGIPRGEIRLLSLEAVYPHLNRPATGRGMPSVSKIRSYFGKSVHITNASRGIGDHIVGSYVCAGLARAGVRVVFHTQHAEWLGRINEPNLVISTDKPKPDVYDLQYDYPRQLRHGTSRVRWYTGGLHPLLKPVKPEVNLKRSMDPLPFERYVLVSPFAHRSTRDWPEIHWTRLAHLLRDAKYEVVAIGIKNDQSRLENAFATTQAYWAVDHSAEWVINAMLGAAAYVGVDSGMTHLAALLNVRTVAIHAHLEPEFLWPAQSVKSVSPDAKCVFCHWQGDRGWLNSCEKSCSALATVRPEAVLAAISDAKSHHAEQI